MAGKQPEFGRTAQPGTVAALLALIVFGGLFALRQLGMLQGAELAAYDLFLAWRPNAATAPERVVLVEITEADIQRLGRWPLTDKMLAELLERIEAQKPQAIGVDIYRDQPIAPGSAALERALTNKNIFVVEKFGGEGGQSVGPPAVLANTDRVGFSDIVVDADGMVRRGLLFLDDGREVHYALPLRLALNYLAARDIYPRPGDTNADHMKLGEVTLAPLEASDGGYAGADARGYQYLIDYRDAPASIGRVSYLDAMTNAPSTRVLAGKIVIVGVAAASVTDYFSAPVSVSAQYGSTISGIELHARMASQLVRAALQGHRPPAILGDGVENIWTLLWVLGGILAGWRIRSLWRFAGSLALGLLAMMLAGYALLFAGWWVPVVPAALAWVGAGGLMTAYMANHEQSQRLFLMDIFSRHVSKDVAEEIWRQRNQFLSGGRPEARSAVATILFADIEDFTPVAERLDAAALMDWLNRYLDRMVDVAIKHAGVVDDYYGDAIKINFGVPLACGGEDETRECARLSALCALRMREEISRLNQELSEGGLPPVRMRIGICTGPIVAGCLGSARRMKYTTVGDTVNTAARLESYGKDVAMDDADNDCCRIMASESTAALLEGKFKVRRVGNLALKGKSAPVTVYSILAYAPNPSETRI